jgi:hypothetical protein
MELWYAIVMSSCTNALIRLITKNLRNLVYSSIKPNLGS